MEGHLLPVQPEVPNGDQGAWFIQFVLYSICVYSICPLFNLCLFNLSWSLCLSLSLLSVESLVQLLHKIWKKETKLSNLVATSWTEEAKKRKGLTGGVGGGGGVGIKIEI